MNGEEQYLKILERLLLWGETKENRTGIDTLVIPPTMIQHDMRKGFPLLTTKNVAFKPIRTELEFFIKGLTDKEWLKKRGNHIWDEWAKPQAVDKYMEETGETDRKKAQLNVNNLGSVYGFQWRHWDGIDYGIEGNAEMRKEIAENRNIMGLNMMYGGRGIDQLANIVDTLKTNPNDRRMICNAWNPNALNSQALPPCHYSWQVTHINGTLHLNWNQRSVDTFLGLPFNLASYALLLHLLCKETGMKEGTVTGFLADVHIYKNHIDQVREQLRRERYDLPTIETTGFTSIFDWEHTMTKSIGYKHHPKLVGDVAV